jgi:hypothetical protein
MRIWTLHPMYLDRQGLLAVWREGLLAQSVLLGRTEGYTHHPQLTRFRKQPDPVGAIATYLRGVHAEAVRRGYRFDVDKIRHENARKKMRETRGQLLYEWAHLIAKLQRRCPQLARKHQEIKEPLPHPLFTVTQGGIRGWEKLAKSGRTRE